MVEYKTLPYTLENIQLLQSLWKDNWQLCTIYDNIIFLSRPIKKEVKSRALTTESNKWIAYLKMQRDRIDSWEEIHYPDFVNNRSEWVKFVNFWIQKNTEDWKLHCEKQKTFDAQARWRVWITWNEESKSKTSIW